MKKDKRETVKAARKAIRNQIRMSLVNKLKEVLDEFGQTSKDLEKEIEKAAVKLSKKLSKEAKIDPLVNWEADGKQQTAPEQLKAKIGAKQNLQTSEEQKGGIKAKKRLSRKNKGTSDVLSQKATV